MRKDFRNFRIDRMRDPEVLDVTFAIDDAVSLDDYLRVVQST